MSLKDRIVEKEKLRSKTFNEKWLVFDGPYQYPNSEWWKMTLEEKHEIWIRKSLRRLVEAFKLPNIEFVEEMVHELYANPDKAFDIFKKYNLNLKTESFDDLVLAVYNVETKETSIILSNIAVNMIDAGQNENLLIREIEAALVHENTHQQQDQGKFADQMPKYIRGENDYIGHYSQKTEIIAWARTFAFEMEKFHKHNLENCFKALSQGNIQGIMNNNKEVFRIYQEIGGKVFKKLKHEMYNYFVERDKDE
jgi:hypothetical protein